MRPWYVPGTARLSPSKSRSNLARSSATAMSCHSSGCVQSYPVPVWGPAQPSKPNPAWGLNAQNHSKCILVMLVLPTVSRRHTTTVGLWSLVSRHAEVGLHHTSSDDV